MDINKFLLVSLAITLINCGCNDDDLITYRLTEEGRNFIQVDNSITAQYTNESGTVVTATIDPRIGGLQESGINNECPSYITEFLNYKTNFESINLSVATSIGSLENSLLRVNMTKQNGGVDLKLVCLNFDSEIFTTDYESNGFLFENVYVFNACIVDDAHGVGQIVYTPEKGIEFIKFDDGGYLRLVD